MVKYRLVSGCILSIVRNRSTKNSNFLFLTSNIKVIMATRFSIVAACGRCWVAIPAIASAR